MALVRLPMSEGRALLDAAAQKKLGAKVNTRGGARPAHKTGVMNKTEAKFAEILEGEKLAGRILGYWFESVTLRLAADVRYTPDFLVQTYNGRFHCYEVKGFMRDDARVKLRVAASKFPCWDFSLAKLEKGGNWVVTKVPSE